MIPSSLRINIWHALVLTPSHASCSDMILESLLLLSLSILSVFVWGSSASGQDQSTLGDTPWCAGLGESAIDTLARFSLYAWNTDCPNINSTGTPLCWLRPVQLRLLIAIPLL